MQKSYKGLKFIAILNFIVALVQFIAYVNILHTALFMSLGIGFWKQQKWILYAYPIIIGFNLMMSFLGFYMNRGIYVDHLYAFSISIGISVLIHIFIYLYVWKKREFLK